MAITEVFGGNLFFCAFNNNYIIVGLQNFVLGKLNCHTHFVVYDIIL